MKKDNYNLLILIVFIIIFMSFVISCKKKKYNTQTETITIELTETSTINDSINDSIPIIYIELKVNQDSIDRVELIRDSIQFRKITKKINGGYNGFDDRYAIWLRARNVLKNKNK